MNDIIVIGGGAAGLTAALAAAEEGRRVLLLEKMPRCGRKIRITGKGRCNVTTNKTTDEIMQAVRTNSRFMYSSLAAFDNRQVMAFFETHGCPLKVERGGRVFPVSDHAQDIVDTLVRAAKAAGVEVQTDQAAAAIEQDGQGLGLVMTNGDHLKAQAVILATGGKSYPLTGSTGDGQKMAETLGLKVTPLYPALVPLTASDPWIVDLMGLSLRNVDVCVKDPKGKRLYSERGEMLFTHFGVSGPVILSASGHCAKFWLKNRSPLTIHIDLKPALSDKQLDARLLREIEASPKRQLQNMLKTLLPHKLIDVFLRRADIPAFTQAGDLTRPMRHGLLELMKDFTVHVTGTRSFNEAIVTAGGISVKEIDPKTMAVKKVPGLYAAGEVLDLDAYTGGFNLQIAFSTGHAAGKAAAAYIEEKEKEAALQAMI
jgi:predicted Rossmann fold flavoprotein